MRIELAGFVLPIDANARQEIIGRRGGLVDDSLRIRSVVAKRRGGDKLIMPLPRCGDGVDELTRAEHAAGFHLPLEYGVPAPLE